MKRLVLIASLFLAGCAVQKTMMATGGSRADGTVNVSYDYGLYEQPVVDINTGNIAAKNSCKAWGYKDAQPFGGQQSKCDAFNGYGTCVHTIVTIPYQCTGSPK